MAAEQSYVQEILKIINDIKENSVTEINLERKGIRHSTANLIANALKTNPNINKINLNYNYQIEQGINQIFIALAEHNKTLEEIHLDYVHLSREHKCYENLAHLIRAIPSLNLISLEGNYITADGIRIISSAIHDKLMATLTENIEITSIAFSRSPFCKIVFQTNAKEVKTLLDIDLSKNHPIFSTDDNKGKRKQIKEDAKLQNHNIFYTAVGSALAKIISVNNSIKILDLEGSGLQGDELTQIFNSLRNNTTIEEINLSGINLSENNIIALTHALKTNESIKNLNLSNCNLNHRSAELISQALAVNTSLESLVMRSAKIWDYMVEHIANAIINNKNCRLKTLDLSDNSIGDSGAEYLGIMLATNQTLINCKLEGNRIEKNGNESLLISIRANENSKIKVINGYEVYPSIENKTKPASRRPSIVSQYEMKTDLSEVESEEIKSIPSDDEVEPVDEEMPHFDFDSAPKKKNKGCVIQ